MRYFMTLLFVLLAYAVFAQNDPKAKEILDKAAAKFKAYPAAEIDFTLTMENPSENIHEMHEGKAWMKGNLYKLLRREKYLYLYAGSTGSQHQKSQ